MKKLLIVIIVLLGAMLLGACAPTTEKTENTKSSQIFGIPVVIGRPQSVPQVIAERQENNPHDSKFEVSHEARDKAIAAVKNEKKVTESFYLQLGNTRIKVIPGFHPDHQGDGRFLDRENKTLYYDDSWYDMADGPEGLAKFHFLHMIDVFTTMWWADTINAETGDHYFNISNQAWKNEIVNECQFGQQAFMALISWPGYENLVWEDYCHKNVAMIPPFPKDF